MEIIEDGRVRVAADQWLRLARSYRGRIHLWSPVGDGYTVYPHALSFDSPDLYGAIRWVHEPTSSSGIVWTADLRAPTFEPARDRYDQPLTRVEGALVSADGTMLPTFTDGTRCISIGHIEDVEVVSEQPATGVNLQLRRIDHLDPVLDAWESLLRPH